MTDQDDHSGQYGQPPGASGPGQYGQPPGASGPGQYGQPPGASGPGQYGQPPGASGPGQYGQPPGASGPGQYGQLAPGSQGSPAAYPGAGSPAIPYTDWPHRAGGYLLDNIPVFIIVFIGAIIHIAFVIVLFYLAALAFWIYNRCVLGGRGQSLGKRVMSIKLLSEETGQPIGTLMAFVRDICHILDSLACYIGWLFPLWDAKRQTFADKIMRTVVVPV
jgi:uncharacterized RDD family membrane protein YckC